jgi:anti-anti-sigma regulatory factor
MTRDVAVDASAAACLNSAGVTLLVHETDAHHRAGGRPELRNPSRAVLQALRLTGMADLFDVVTD